MGKNVDCGIVGYSPQSTCIRIDPSESTGPYWHRVLPLCRGQHLVLDLSLVQDAQKSFLQDLQVMASMLQRKQMMLVLNNVPISVVEILGEKKDSLRDVQVMNLLAPYRCPSCQKDTEVIIPLRKELTSNIETQIEHPESISCRSCRTPMSFQGDHRTFFSSAADLLGFEPESRSQADLAIAIQDAEGTGPRDRMSMSQNLSRHVWWLGLDQNNTSTQNAAAGRKGLLSRELVLAASLLFVNIVLFVWLVSRLE